MMYYKREGGVLALMGYVGIITEDISLKMKQLGDWYNGKGWKDIMGTQVDKDKEWAVEIV